MQYKISKLLFANDFYSGLLLKWNLWRPAQNKKCFDDQAFWEVCNQNDIPLSTLTDKVIVTLSSIGIGFVFCNATP